MAVIQNIPESKQTPSAQKGLLKYCMRPDKTNLNEQVKLVSGHNCVPEMAHKSFLATQALYKAEQEKHIAEGKDNVLFYQYVQSFSPKDDLTPEQAHAIGMQFVREYFPNHEVVVATHLDNNQLHNHFVINATSFKDGSKLHMNKYTLADMRRLNDEICLARGLSVLKPYDPTKPSLNLGQREWRAQEKGESWKFELLIVITDLMKKSGSKQEFIDKLRERGYDVRWEEHHKTMTYTCPNGMKVRDNKLHDARFMKEAMEREFRIREQHLEQIARLAEGESQRDRAGTLSADSLRDTERTMGADAFAAERADGVSGETAGSNEKAPDREGDRELHEHDAEYSDGNVQGADGESEGERPTGWEQSREVYFRGLIIEAGAEQGIDLGAGRDDQTPAEVYDSSLPVLAAAVGDGLAVILELASVDSSEDPEEQRRRIEATIACQNLGFVIGIVIGLIRAAESNRSEQVKAVRNELDQQVEATEQTEESDEQEEQQEVTEQTEEVEEQPIEEQTM